MCPAVTCRSSAGPIATSPGRSSGSPHYGAATSKRSLPAVGALGEWLGATVPVSQRASVVHGDCRAGNLMFAREAPPPVTAILDWEIATLGDPLADLGYLTATYAEEGIEATPLELTSVTRLRWYLQREEIAALYQEKMKVRLVDLRWYQAAAPWKAALFCEALYTRWLDGERPSDTAFGPSLERGVPRLLDGASDFAGISTVRSLRSITESRRMIIAKPRTFDQRAVSHDG